MLENNLHQQNVSNTSEDVSVKNLVLLIREWLRYLKSKWLIILLAGFIGGIAGIFSAYYTKPVYLATLTFALEDESGGGRGGGLGGLASQFGFDLGSGGGGAFSGSSLTELIKSRNLIERTLLSPISVSGKQTTLAEFYIEATNMRQGMEKNPKLRSVFFLPNVDRSAYPIYQDSLLGTMYTDIVSQKLNVDQKDKQVNIIYVEVRSENEMFSKVFAETLVKVVSELYTEIKSKKARQNVAILERQADSIRAELNSAISGVASSNDNTFNLNPGLNIKRVPSVRRQVDVQANTAILTQLVGNLELAKITLRKETPLIQVIDHPILPLKKVKPGRLKSGIQYSVAFAFFIIAALIIRRWYKQLLSH